MIAALSFLGYALMALLGFGFVIAIHEFGHFLFAKWAGVRVDAFAIGFGPAVLKKRVGETDYQLCLLPLGGYVKMLGQEDVPSGEAQPAVDPRSFLAKSFGWKAMIMLGGVLFNLISSYVILLGLVAWGMPVFQPVVGEVEPLITDQRGLPVESPAARLGLRRGDRLVEVDGEKVRSFDDVMTAVIFAGGRPLEVVVERGAPAQRIRLPAEGAPPVEPVFEGRLGRPSLGIGFPWSNRVILADGVDAGVQRFDRVLTIAGEDVSGLIGQDIQDRLLRHFGRPVAVAFQRGDERRETTLTYAGPDGAFDVRAGVPVRLIAVNADGPAAAAGLRTGDWVLAVDGTPVSGATHFLALVRRGLDATGTVALAVLRDGVRQEHRVTGASIFGVQRLGLGVAAVGSGVLAVLPPGLDGQPGLLERTGLKPGDALVAWQPQEKDVRIGWVSGGTVQVLPLGLDRTAWIGENRYREPGLLRKVLGAKPEPGLAALLSGVRVSAVHAADLEVVPAGEGPAKPQTIARSRLGPAADGLAVGDWIADARLGPDGAVIEVVRGASDPRWASLAPPEMGTALLFEREELPYQPTSTGDAIALVNDAAYNLVVKSVLLIPRLFRSPEAGGVDPNKSLTGPIGIFRELKARAELMGFDSFLKLIALVGLNLFIVNLLPIPITDGGQLLMLSVEQVIRRPLPLRLRNALMWFGVGLVGLLFAYICGLDILRLFGIA